MPAIADDSGLVVDALDGEPGLFSSSYGGLELDSKERNNFLLEMMKNKEHRSAKFVCTIVCYFPGGSYLTAEGQCPGSIAFSPRGSGGFGYDPVFLAGETGRTMAELSREEKNEVSHRGAALRIFAQRLRERGQ